MTPRFFSLSILAVAVSVAMAALGCSAAQAQTLRSGLWEHTVALKSQSGEMEKALTEMQQLAAMPPAQRRE